MSYYNKWISQKQVSACYKNPLCVTKIMSRHTEKVNIKNSIAHAYLKALEEKEADAISISSITQSAKVSRMAFYRNFASKQDIIEYYLTEVLWTEMSEKSPENSDFWTLEYGIRFFKTMQTHKDLILLLEKRGYASLILQSFNQINEYTAGDMPQNSIKRYELYYIAGASFNAMLVWLREGCKESPENMAINLAEYIGISCTKGN